MVFAFWRHKPRTALLAAGLLAAGLLAALSVGSPAAAETLTVNVDESKIIRLPEKVSTIVIGNPLIADASLQSGGFLVLTGKGFGSTNFIALDRNGRTVQSSTVKVVSAAATDIVFVYRGMDRETYSCSPMCEPRITLGDSPAFFGATIGQTGARNGAATPAPTR